MDLVESLRQCLKDYDAQTRMKTFMADDEIVGIVGDNLVAMKIKKDHSIFYLADGRQIESGYKYDDMIEKASDPFAGLDKKETIN